MPYIISNKKVAVELDELVPKFWNTLNSFYSEIQRYKEKPFGIKRLQVGGNGRKLLIDFDSLKQEIQEALGDPRKANHPLEPFFEWDAEATVFYRKFKRAGVDLKADEQERYIINASVMQAVVKLEQARIQERIYRKGKLTGIIETLRYDVESFQNYLKVKHDVQHTLPVSIRFKQLLKEFKDDKYITLIKDPNGTGKQNARLVDDKLESLIISLYCLPTKPFVEVVHTMYYSFLNGEIEVANIKTGELYNRYDFYKKDKPKKISVATIWNYINAPHNALIIKKARNGSYDFNHKNRPHVNRTAPEFSMSKISLDDRDIMHTKLPDGSKVMAYYAYDDMSTAMIGIAHSKSKNHQLYIDCLKSMFQFTTSKGIGTPLQLEVEHHLVSDFKDDLMLAGNVFPFVRWCNPTNSQEKYAERLIGVKKYDVEKQNNQNVGRHYSRLDSNRTTLQKIYDEQNDNYKEAKASYETIVANELSEQIEYNNELHPNQKLFKGKTRLQVFLENINPNLPKFDKSYLAKYIGNHTQTSIRRSQYVTVQYQKYQLENPSVLRFLAPNNYEVDAYYMTDINGEIKEVFIYQKDNFICKCEPVPTFNRANAEWTDADKQGYENATKYISQFDKMVKENTTNKLEKVTIFKTNNDFIDVTPEVVEIPKQEPVFEMEYLNIQTERTRAINDL
ncbi:hypothetical protein [Flavobacterium columnare]|uniref:Uncharacterized protein n=1 Tax=Flavobacterium columnare TaxID=996 RepID=A0AAJ3ZJU9_9FLAO|nr:hypothetical protein [Flavobacterium columnare]AUX17380.1 hypothetical protein AQ623_03025 [Flavobacterium columnare]QCV57105.1 hypothetical protein UN65_02940 [Flavobacterium columnare]QOG56404.1 hypothetical protein HUE29_02985 [Flavobacterium columnare]QOG59129.1 hypothetical protein HUE30_02990 [Flavobacterium columnare]QOG61849.1 hypothetical protein HUE31_02990 [Flavobacterium columnare]